MDPKINTIYNAECPVCRFEIDHYRAYSTQADLPLTFCDLNTTDLAAWGLSPDQAARRLHVLKDGQLYAGMPAFFVLWRQMPKYHWLARLIDRAVLRPTAIAAYEWVLAPLIYRWHLRRTTQKIATDAQHL
ncbi:MAG: putative DCC family thiol-disulfide oxidoreductase YuxK [Paracoccaceae bacterium]|jgi:predicted DCC family thiol-disulfide oxidoreductase YuxK